MGKREDVIQEIRQKVEDYESRQSSFLSEFNSWSDIFTVKSPKKASSSRNFSNPRLTEGFRAAKALSSTAHRMITASDPYFECIPMDVMLDVPGLKVIENTIQTQLTVSQHKRKLLRALVSEVIFGTVIVEEPFEVIGVNNHGRRMPLTNFEPRSLLQVAFDRNTYDIELADWVTVADILSKDKLKALAANDTQDIWIKGEIEAAYNDNANFQHPSLFIESRLQSAGYNVSDEYGKTVRELITYRGKLDTLNDGLEYIVGLVNRKYLVRFHPNNFQHGRRNLRVARWFEYELEPLAYGLGKLLSSQHKSMDANRQKVQDSITFDTYSMWLLDRMANINAQDFHISPHKIIETDNINGMRRVEANVGGAEMGLKLEEILKSEFQAASGATPTLQAIVTEATATETSLAQNEALRDISIRAEQAAESLVRQHIEVMHSNNIANIGEPFNIYLNGQVKRVYPADLWYDVDFRIKVVTDKDYKPQRLKSMMEALQVWTSVRNISPELAAISLTPLAKEILRTLGVDVQTNTPQMQQMILQMQQQLQAGTPGGGPQSQPGLSPAMPGPPPGMAPSENILHTPVGPVLGSPQ